MKKEVDCLNYSLKRKERGQINEVINMCLAEDSEKKSVDLVFIQYTRLTRMLRPYIYVYANYA